jgi:UDP-N-acetylglucosamine 2-epimerase (non-hydrolysing)
MSQKESKPIAIVGGARPNFMKIVPLARELNERNIPHYVVNAGQHFSKEMSQEFFNEFNLVIDFELTPSVENLEKQRDDIFKGLENIFIENPPSMVVVVGDVNSTYIAAQVADKLNIRLVHVEAGFRSYNDKMPEEFNRVETDKIADLKLASSENAAKILHNEGLGVGVHVVGNIMIDLLKLHEPAVKDVEESFYFATLHRSENVDDKDVFNEILCAFEEISEYSLIYLPLHPRTRKMAEKFGFMERLAKACVILPSLSYVECIYYQKNAKAVLTDSGGIQEEASVLGTPCITMRTETERPITVERGTSVVAGVTKNGILKVNRELNFYKRPARIPLWDGKTAHRIVDILVEYSNDSSQE